MNTKYLSCDGLGLGPFQIISGLWHSKDTEVPEWLKSSDRDIIFTYQARNAISLICQMLKIGPGDEVIVPAYNCGAEIDPYIRAGAKAVLYRIDNRARIDVEDIMRRLTPATRIIHVTHFFGWPQEISELAELCRKRGVLLLEDCAQALFSKGGKDIIGQIGDVAIYSFVKSLPVPDGGALVLSKNTWKENKPFLQPPSGLIFRNCLPLAKKWFMVYFELWQRFELTRKLLTKSWLNKNSSEKIPEQRPAMLSSNYFDERKIDWTLSGITRGRLAVIDPAEIVATRRRNYLHLHEGLLNTPNFIALFDSLPEDVCPLSFPFLVTDRHRWYKALGDKGILVLGWPGYYPGFAWEEFPEACNLKDNLLTVPVHQNLEIRHMEYIVGCIKDIAAGNMWYDR